MDIQKIYSQLISQFPDLEIYQNHPLAPYTTVKIGGPADIFIHTKSSNDFLKILKIISILNTKYLIPNTILGNGSNVLISDTGIRGIVIKNSSSEIEILPNNQVKVASGVQFSQLINFTLDHNLVGLEEFSYIPSTVGGAIAGDIHGDDKHLFSKFIDSVEYFSTINDLPVRQAGLQSTILFAILKLTPGDSIDAKQKVKDIIEKKSQNQPINSLGCVFKNPPESTCVPIWGEKRAAGWIIDNELKLKGYAISDAQISPLHANFIVNNGYCTATDYLSLINLVQSQMQTKFNFQFEFEIKLLGNF